MSFSQLTEQQVIDLAPDISAARSGRELAVESKWTNTGANEKAVWGECAGSGAKRYKTQIDLSDVAFKCSCPSRKFPCKHGLGLFLLYIRDPEIFGKKEAPDWVNEWLSKRAARVTKKTEKPEKPVDAKAQAKRREARGRRIEDGVDELLLWIKDLVRNGILGVTADPGSFWKNMSRRMIDAQAQGLAALVRRLGESDFSRDGWQTRFLDRLAHLYTVAEAYRHIDELDPLMQAEVRSWVGFGQSLEELKQREGIRDTWIVLARTTDNEDNITTMRYWLYGVNSTQFALVLQFHVRNRAPAVSMAAGTAIEAELVFYEGLLPYRAAIRTQTGVKAVPDVPALPDWEEVLREEARWISVSPFIDRKPAIVDNVRLVQSGGQWCLEDSAAKIMQLPCGYTGIFSLLAQSGGRPSKLFVLGEQLSYEPFGIWIDGKYSLT